MSRVAAKSKHIFQRRARHPGAGAGGAQCGDRRAAPHTALELRFWRITAGTHTARLRCVVLEFGRDGEFALDAGVQLRHEHAQRCGKWAGSPSTSEDPATRSRRPARTGMTSLAAALGLGADIRLPGPTAFTLWAAGPRSSPLRAKTSDWRAVQPAPTSPPAASIC
jgi:hypothetical protein